MAFLMYEIELTNDDLFAIDNIDLWTFRSEWEERIWRGEKDL